MRRVLLLTYYYPPSGGPGVQRALKFSRYLRDFGWQPTVLTVRPEDAAYPALDEALLHDVPPDVDVVRTRTWDPYAGYARLVGRKNKRDAVVVGFGGTADTWQEYLARWVRANVFLPDARVGWVPFAYRTGKRLLAETRHDALITTGPPHSTHLAGLLLARATGLPWLADFRDPWTEIDYRSALPQTAAARRLDAALERAVLRRADAVTTVTPTWARGLARRHDRAYSVVMNGFDPADFAGAAVPVDAETCWVTYVGNVNQPRNPSGLWPALRDVDAPRTMPKLRIRFIGQIDPVVQEDAARFGVADRVDVLPYVPHHEAVRALQESAALLLVINRIEQPEGIMTGKLFEYLASGRPTLALGPVGGDAAAALEHAQGGTLFDWDDAAGIADFLRRHYAAWEAGTPLPGAGDPDRLAPYSRVGQAGAIARLLDGLVALPPGR